MAALRGRLAKAAGNPVFERYRSAFGKGALPRVAVFTGAGASHSWIWFADLLERMGLFDVRFIDERLILEGGLACFDFLLVGGGDTYAMADSLGDAGARELEAHVEGGGLYMGSCAGAYLVLTGVGLEPFTPFELVDGDMLNVMLEPPPPLCLAHKYLAPYGEEWVFHPVYGEVELGPGPAAAGFPCFERGNSIRSVLFGGPVLSAQNDEEVVAVYSGLTGRAAYPWPRDDAERLVTGKPAVLRARRGQGTAVASGPHLEHPLFPGANALAAELMLMHWRGGLAPTRAEGDSARSNADDTGARERGRVSRSQAREVQERLQGIKRQVSNARIVAFGLEKMPVTWRIGVKVWEPEKIRMFLEYAWYRLPYMVERAPFIFETEELESLAEGYSRVTALVKSLKIKVESEEDSQADAVSLLTLLKELTATFLSLYFRLRLEEDVS